MNPIEAAVLPLKTEAINRAEQEARKVVDRVAKEMAAAGGNRDVVAPRPKNVWDRVAYDQMMSKSSLVRSLTKATWTSRKPTDPDMAVMDQSAISKFIQDARKDAATNYDAFVAKLNSKIGEAKSADLQGNHVWGYSILKVETASGETQRWKTQQIVNVSKLGKMFNQWPTRKVK